MRGASLAEADEPAIQNVKFIETEPTKLCVCVNTLTVLIGGQNLRTDCGAPISTNLGAREVTPEKSFQ